MRRDQLDHAILGTYHESRPPAAATMSIEVDILLIADSNETR